MPNNSDRNAADAALGGDTAGSHVPASNQGLFHHVLGLVEESMPEGVLLTPAQFAAVYVVLVHNTDAQRVFAAVGDPVGRERLAFAERMLAEASNAANVDELGFGELEKYLVAGNEDQVTEEGEL